MAEYRIDPEAVSDKPMRSQRFFELYFSKFKYLILANLFLLPFNLAAAGIAALVYKLFGALNIPAAAVGLIVLNVGMSGVALICRYICSGKEFSAFTAFKKGIKENALRFTIHGVMFYAVFAVSFLSISLYYNGTKTNGIFWVPLVITGLIALFVLFASYYMNVMTVTMDISLKDTYRNCALFSFGELKNNILATVALAILAAVIFTVAYIVNEPITVLVILGVLQLFLIPSTVQYIITFYVYDDMIGILDESRRAVKDDEDEASKPEQPMLEREEARDIDRLAHDSKDEYIFYNGRMIKRSEVEKMLQDDE